MHAQGAVQAKRISADDGLPDHALKKRGNLAATLNPLLEPRLQVGQPGRPKGTSDYEWTAETDSLLTELCAKWGPAKAKNIIARRILEGRPAGSAPRPDSVRKVVERRMVKLGIPAGQKRRKPATRRVRRWTKSQTAALLGALGADATIESIAARTDHSVKSVRAKLARLDYEAHEIHGSTVFTVNTLAAMLLVTPRRIRRWKERGWLETEDRRITEAGLRQFLRAHPDLIAFDSLGRADQLFLADVGFPCQRAATFKKNAREILDGIGKRRKPRRPVRIGEISEMKETSGEKDADRDDASTLSAEASA
jgi:hypothetical protein